ncbi:unnamed protein product [Schistocephalus solidus]|uniref:CBFD_NFYB_HMF domain-containing protein n=1 Tax=Schistocephalus solidus TaxID=70667 RepID=A0A183T1Y0_SCHSO|nr:unnamed protein product [Schistocephalus solidus]
MNSMSENQNDEPSYAEAAYYETIEGNTNDHDDRFLPIANVSKIMKRAIPPNGKVAKDAKECVQECVSEFISFITSEAAERCQNEKRKTINGEDILCAMGSLGFENYVEPLKTFLLKLRDVSCKIVPLSFLFSYLYTEPHGETAWLLIFFPVFSLSTIRKVKIVYICR